MNEKWRLVTHAPYSGALNMAIDESILLHVADHSVLPTLRLYAWYPFTLSLGHAQSFLDVDMSSIKSLGYELVRRPTGGRAILHADELTYSVSVPDDNKLIMGSVLESYRTISSGLLKGLDLVGISSESKLKDESEKHLSKNAVCFEYPSDYEITSNGKKLIGSAQARKNNGLLQHGAIPLYGDITRIIDTLSNIEDHEREVAKERLRMRATTISIAAEKRITWRTMADALAVGFSETMGIQFIKSALTNSEIKKAKELVAEKYANDSWTKRV